MRIVDHLFAGHYNVWDENPSLATKAAESAAVVCGAPVVDVTDVWKLFRSMTLVDFAEMKNRDLSLQPPFNNFLFTWRFTDRALVMESAVHLLASKDPQDGTNLSGTFYYLFDQGSLPRVGSAWRVTCDPDGTPDWNLSYREDDLSLLRRRLGIELSVWNEAKQKPHREIGLPVMALQLLNCKNVHVRERHCDAKLAKRYEQRHGHKRPIYYVLDIEPMRKIFRDANGGKDGISLAKALHICRGHFKNFDEKPLFGKLKGTYWWQPHVRGDAESGVVDKDYRIKLPKP